MQDIYSPGRYFRKPVRLRAALPTGTLEAENQPDIKAADSWPEWRPGAISGFLILVKQTRHRLRHCNGLPPSSRWLTNHRVSYMKPGSHQASGGAASQRPGDIPLRQATGNVIRQFPPIKIGKQNLASCFPYRSLNLRSFCWAAERRPHGQPRVADA
jgi:hypothetical protein